jgi:hypothetical protein
MRGTMQKLLGAVLLLAGLALLVASVVELPHLLQALRPASSAAFTIATGSADGGALGALFLPLGSVASFVAFATLRALRYPTNEASARRSRG